MSQNLRNYTKTIYALDAVLQRAPSDRWDDQSPCDAWTARQVLGHYMWGLQRVATVANGTPPPEEKSEADVAGPDPLTSWAETRDTVLAALDQPGALANIVDGPFGPGPLDAFLQIHTMDGLLHTWDLATTFGIDAFIPTDLAEAGTAGIAAAGDGIRSPGLFGPAVACAADADAVTRFVAIAGRTPH
jgi:uncharacterized protein (TIGR03086 family)